MFWTPALKTPVYVHSALLQAVYSWDISDSDITWLTSGEEINNVTDNQRGIFLEKYMVAEGHDSGGVRFLSWFLPSKSELSYLNLSPQFSLGKSMGKWQFILFYCNCLR